MWMFCRIVMIIIKLMGVCDALYIDAFCMTVSRNGHWLAKINSFLFHFSLARVSNMFRGSHLRSSTCLYAASNSEVFRVAWWFPPWPKDPKRWSLSTIHREGSHNLGNPKMDGLWLSRNKKNNWNRSQTIQFYFFYRINHWKWIVASLYFEGKPPGSTAQSLAVWSILAPGGVTCLGSPPRIRQHHLCPKILPDFSVVNVPFYFDKFTSLLLAESPSSIDSTTIFIGPRAKARWWFTPHKAQFIPNLG